MTTTASSTHCSKNRLLDWVWRWVAALGLLAALLPDGAAWAVEAAAIEVPQMRLERSEEGLFLSATVRFELPALVSESAQKGIPLYFVAEAEVLRDRWYWYDKRIAQATRYMRLVYQPLTRRWRLQTSPTPLGNAGLGVNLGQGFDDLDDALAAVQRISRWRLAEASELDPDARHNVDFRFRLDISQLPRPIQLGVSSQADWNLAVTRNMRVLTEAAK